MHEWPAGARLILGEHPERALATWQERDVNNPERSEPAGAEQAGTDTSGRVRTTCGRHRGSGGLASTDCAWIGDAGCRIRLDRRPGGYLCGLR